MGPATFLKNPENALTNSSHHLHKYILSHYFLPAPEDFAGISSWDLSLCQLRSKKGNFCNQLHTGHCCTSIYRPEDIDHDDHDEHEDDDHGD